MADEVQQQEPAQESVSEVAEQPSAEAAHDPVQQQAEATVTEPGAAEHEPHPLEPGGDRFKQIYARTKEAEREAKALATELQREREQRIRLEERERVKTEAAQPQEKEYTWAELRQFINDGRLTVDQAAELRETYQEKRFERKQQALIYNHLTLNTREATINDGIARYKKANPNITKDGTPEREKLVREYRYHVDVLGFPATKATELAAARAAFGDVDALETQNRLKAKPVEREGHMETASTRPATPKTKDPWEALDARSKDHYTRMIKNGRYGSYRPKDGITAEHLKAVREELTYKRVPL